MPKIKTKDNKVVDVLKPFNGDIILKAGICGKVFEKYVMTYGYREYPTSDQIAEMASDTALMSALITKGFVAVLDDADKFYIGSTYKVKVPAGTKTLQLIRVTDPYKGKPNVIWALVNPVTGERWNGSYPSVEKPFLNKKEFEAVTGTKQPVGNFIKGMQTNAVRE